MTDLIEPRMGLTFGPPNEPLRAAIADLAIPAAAKAGLWLLHDFFEESHAISQDLDTPDGSYWHGILHRREGDASNARYWLRKIGQHSILPALKKAAVELGYNYTNPPDFVDYCELVKFADKRLAEAVQMAEWKLLFEHCMDGNGY